MSDIFEGFGFFSLLGRPRSGMGDKREREGEDYLPPAATRHLGRVSWNWSCCLQPSALKSFLY